MKQAEKETEGSIDTRWQKPSAERQASSRLPSNDRSIHQQLHKQFGNQVLQELHNRGERPGPRQVSSPRDTAEREAEEVTDQVVESPARDHQPSTHTGTGSEQINPGQDSPLSDNKSQDQSPLRGGQPLRPETRSWFESRLGGDFSQVRVHTGPDAAEAARSLQAEAFTVGNDIVFAENNFAPESDHGRQLLAHELTHTLQNQGPPRRIYRQAAEGAQAESPARGFFTPEVDIPDWQAVSIPPEPYQAVQGTVWQAWLDEVAEQWERYLDTWETAVNNVGRSIGIDEAEASDEWTLAIGVLEDVIRGKLIDAVSEQIESFGGIYGEIAVELFNIGQSILEGMEEASQPSDVSATLNGLANQFQTLKNQLGTYRNPDQMASPSMAQVFRTIYRMGIYDQNTDFVFMRGQLETQQFVQSLRSLVGALGEEEITEIMQKGVIDAIVLGGPIGSIEYEIRFGTGGAGGFEYASRPVFRNVGLPGKIKEALDDAGFADIPLHELGYDVTVTIHHPVFYDPTPEARPEQPPGPGRNIHGRTWTWVRVKHGDGLEVIDYGPRARRQGINNALQRFNLITHPRVRNLAH